jgi:hypothetical protein
VREVKGGALPQKGAAFVHLPRVHHPQREGYIILMRLDPSAHLGHHPIGYVHPINDRPPIAIYLVTMTRVDGDIVNGNLLVFFVAKADVPPALYTIHICSPLADAVPDQWCHIIIGHNPNRGTPSVDTLVDRRLDGCVVGTHQN